MSVLTFKKTRHKAAADGHAVRLTLFRDREGRVCGWFIAPLLFRPGGVSLAFLPRSERTLASVAVVRGIEAAADAQVPLCVIDPDDLWDSAWGA